jgi:hypothetical protein
LVFVLFAIVLKFISFHDYSIKGFSSNACHKFIIDRF